MSERAPAILLDRDGTINVDTGYLGDPAAVQLEQGAADGLKRLSEAGFPLVVISNQSGVGRGYFGVAEVDAVNSAVADLLAEHGVTVAGWYVCPHAPDQACDCRKPAPGLARQAAGDLGLDLTASWMIGDKRSDLQLADAVGASSILVVTGEGEKHRTWAAANGRPVCGTLVEAAEIILSHVRGAAPLVSAKTLP